MSSMVKRPKPLNHKALRRVVDEIIYTDGGLVETQHAKDEHPSVEVGDIFLGFKEKWSRTEHSFDRKRQMWRYTILTRGVNEKWLKICFVINEKKKRVEIITRFQDEYAKLYRTRLPRPLGKTKRKH